MSGAVLMMATSGGLLVRVSPAMVQGFGTGTVTTSGPLSGTVFGGTAPFTYAWTTLDPDVIRLNSASPFTFFRRNGVMYGEIYSTTATLTVTDAAGQTASSGGIVQFTGT